LQTMGCKGSKQDAVAPKKQPRRSVVCGDSVDPNAAAAYQKKVVPKDEATEKVIRDFLTGDILFSHLESDEVEDLVQAMYEKKFDAGEAIITQGDDNGDEFYVQDGGEVDIIIDGKTVHNQTSGSFGELALIYGTARAATIKAVQPTTCYAMDRDTYRNIIMGSVVRKRQMYEEILKKVSILETLTDWEVSQVADTLESEDFEAGAVIIKQGEPGDHFYIIMQGTAEVTQTTASGETGVVAELKEAQFFGEIALLTSETRKATVTATTKVRTAKMDRDRFTRVLGPIKSILERNMEAYTKYAGN